MKEERMDEERRKTTRVKEQRRIGQRLEEEEGCGKMLFEIHKTVERRNARRIYLMSLQFMLKHRIVE
jgi:hypothetical protein